MEVKYTVCPHDCPDTCAWRVEINDGKIIRVGGDPEHPITQGMVCEKVRNYPERVYGEGRVLYPMKRSGPKGSGEFHRISWEEALQEIQNRWRLLIDEHGAESILPYSYAGTEGIINKASMDRRFFYALGASRLERTICSAAGGLGYQLTYGESKGVNPLLTEEANLIIFWGINALETNIHQAMLAAKAREKGARIIVIDVHRNKTAQWADEFYQLLPGSDGALALGLAHVILRDCLEDAEWIQENAYGIKAFKESVLEYSPERVAKLTGLNPRDIEKLAYDYATTRPSLIRIGNGLQHHDNGGMSTWAIACLPVLIGAWKEKGGGIIKFNSGYFEFDRVRIEKPELLKGSPRIVNMNQLGTALNTLHPPIYSLFVYNSNPATVAPNQTEVLQGLAREDLFTIVHEQIWTDTARFADIVLPATTHLEHSDMYMSYWHGILQWSDPVISPLGESKSNIELFQELAQRMGCKEPCFQDSTESIAKDALDTPFWREQEITLDRLKRERYIALNFPELPFSQGTRSTPSGKLELSSDRAASLGLSSVPVHVPLLEGPESDNPEYTLTLISPPHHNLLNSTFGNMSSIQEKGEEPFLELHPEDAKKRLIEDGDFVEVFNSRGSCVLKAKVKETVLHGVVVAPGVWWLESYQTGYGINALTPERLSDIGNGATFFSCLVEVKKAK